MLKISIDGQAIKDDYGTFANYARQRKMTPAQLTSTRAYIREDNPVLIKLIEDGYVTVKETTEEEKTA